LAEFDRFGVVDQHLGDDAADFGLDLVHHLHGLDDADHRFRATSVPTST
jgi:hypothetical protein